MSLSDLLVGIQVTNGNFQIIHMNREPGARSIGCPDVVDENKS
jgi:hypothetical protein